MSLIWGDSIPDTHKTVEAGVEAAEKMGLEKHSLHGKEIDFLFYGVTIGYRGFGVVKMVVTGGGDVE